MSDKIEVKRCKASVITYTNNWPSSHQCARKATHGDYCKQHAPIDKTVGVQKWMIEYGKIRKVIVNHETEAFMWIDGRNYKQEKKGIHETFDSAKQSLMTQRLAHSECLYQQYIDSKKRYEELSALKEEDCK